MSPLQNQFFGRRHCERSEVKALTKFYKIRPFLEQTLE